MQGRTFFRIMLDNIFVNNPFCKAIASLVNFCNEQSIYSKKELKFLNKMSLNKKEIGPVYKNRFIFDSSQISGIKMK